MTTDDDTTPMTAPGADASATPDTVPVTTPLAAATSRDAQDHRPAAPSTPSGDLPTDEADVAAEEPHESVWSAATVPSAGPGAHGFRSGTLVWGLVLLVLGVLLVLVGVGVHVDPVLALIALLAVLGLGLVVVAALPRRRG